MRATKESVAGRRYLELQRKAQHTARPTDELIQLYALEGFLDRLTRSAHADRFVLKGGVLLAALDARRPTRDIDLASRALENSAAHVFGLIREIAAIEVDDGLVFDAEHATAGPSETPINTAGFALRSVGHCRVPPFAYT